MLNKTSEFIYSQSSLRRGAFFWGLFLFTFAWMNAYASTRGLVVIPDVSPFYGGAWLQKTFLEMGPLLKVYQTVALVDWVYPIFYAGALSMLLSGAMRGRKRFAWINVLPIIGMILDYVENIGLSYVIMNLNDFNYAFGTFLGIVTGLKMMILMPCLVVGLVMCFFPVQVKQTNPGEVLGLIG
jgi:hypothetical protein